MKLVKGRKYWCGWASRYAWFVRTDKRYNPITGETVLVHVFRDVCDCYIECEDKHIEQWVEEVWN